jgi:hypothetical protein
MKIHDATEQKNETRGAEPFIMNVLRIFCFLYSISFLSLFCVADVVTVRTNPVVLLPTNHFVQQGLRSGNGTYVAGVIQVPAVPSDRYQSFIMRCGPQGRGLWTNVLTDFDLLSYPTIACDHRGNLLVSATTAVYPPDVSGTVLRKFTSNGKMLWKRTFGFGDVSSIRQFNDGGILLPTRDGLLVKLNENGDGVWTNRFSDGVGCVAIDTQDNIFVLSRADNALEEIGKFDASGSLVWSNQVALAWLPRLATDAKGDAYFFSGSSLVKVDSEGVFQWTNYLQTSNLFVAPTDVAVDRRGNIHVTGWEAFSRPPRNEIGWAKITADGQLERIKSIPLFSGIAEHPVELPRFTRVQPRGVTVLQHNGAPNGGSYNLVPYTARFRGR